MEILSIILSFLCAALAGFNPVFWTLGAGRPGFPKAEKAALSFVVGFGVISFQMFVYSLLGIRYGIANIMFPHVIIFCFTSMRMLKKGEAAKIDASAAGRNGFGRIDIFMAAVIAFQVLHTFFRALIKPMDSFDSIGNFAFKAKLFFFERAVDYGMFLDPSVNIQHPDYPLFLPLSEAWMYLFAGRANDLLVKMLFPALLLAFVILFYYSLRRLLGRRAALVSTFFIATIPHFVNYATIGYAEFPLILFFTLSFIYLFSWISRNKDDRFLHLSAILAVLALWSKQEGAMLILINVAVLALYLVISRRALRRPSVTDAVYYIFVIALAMGSRLAFIGFMGFENETVNQSTFGLSVALRNLDRIPLILYEYQKHIFGPKKWNLSLFIFFLGLVLHYRRAFRGEFKYITIGVLLGFVGYAAVFVITPLEIRYHLQTAGSRLLLHMIGLVAFWIGYLTKEIYFGEDNIH